MHDAQHHPDSAAKNCAHCTRRAREDFPIHASRERAVARRQFTKLGVIGVVGAVLAQWSTKFWTIGRAGHEPPMRQIALLDRLPVGEAVSFAYPGENDTCLLLRRSDNELLAYSDRCTHLACGVRPQFETGRLNCPCHAGYFDMASGEPLAGPPRKALPRVTLKVMGNVVYATGVVHS